MLEFLWRWGKCPECGGEGARLALWGAAKCRKTACRRFDADTSQLPMPPPPPPPEATTEIPTKGSFRPTNPVTVQYKNFEEQERAYVFEKSSLRLRGKYLVGQAAPTGKCISLNKDRVRNPSVLQGLAAESGDADALWRSLSVVERQIVGYHRLNKKTSPRYEDILRKYPQLRDS